MTENEELIKVALEYFSIHSDDNGKYFINTVEVSKKEYERVHEMLKTERRSVATHIINGKVYKV